MNFVTKEELTELWGKDFFLECYLEAETLRKKVHKEDRVQIPVDLVLAVAVGKALKK